MTSKRQALEALKHLRASMKSNGYEDGSIGMDWVDNIEAALTRQSDEVTVKRADLQRVKDALERADENLKRYRTAYGSDLYTLCTDHSDTALSILEKSLKGEEL